MKMAARYLLYSAFLGLLLNIILIGKSLTNNGLKQLKDILYNRVSLCDEQGCMQVAVTDPPFHTSLA